MGLSVFEDKGHKPTDDDMAQTLGELKEAWDALKQYILDEHPAVVEDWKHYGKSSGWCMKLLRKNRNLFFSYPGENQFAVVFVFGDKAVSAVNESDLPESLKAELNAARKYAEGRGVKWLVQSKEDLEVVKKLVRIKIEN